MTDGADAGLTGRPVPQHDERIVTAQHRHAGSATRVRTLAVSPPPR
ncbi:hypothetical protein [Streptomyces tirandamycinicus]|nr:hypothetical protein [Streptomyces tirandamycinicus]